MVGHRRTADTPAPAGGERADTPAGGGQADAILRMGIRAYALGEGRIRTRRESQRGGREDASPPVSSGDPRSILHIFL
jgi:hypothetical protein